MTKLQITNYNQQNPKHKKPPVQPIQPNKLLQITVAGKDARIV